MGLGLRLGLGCLLVRIDELRAHGGAHDDDEPEACACACACA